MLEIRALTSHYGRVQALHGVSLAVKPRETVALVGANGAGKTTLLNAISGLQRASGGAVLFDGEDITAMPAHRRVRRGIAQVPEGRQVFTTLSVEDNLRLGAYTASHAATARGLERGYAMFPVLAERRSSPAGTLSGGQQQMLAIGRALMAEPRLLLLDEPSMGLAPVVAAEIFAAIAALKRAGTTMLLVEQNAHAALDVADRGCVLETGRIVHDGPANALRYKDELRRAYLAA
ncbi:MAG TPA: ABC transporter ATP-binding protein [Alphaproteobacteria bacterium]